MLSRLSLFACIASPFLLHAQPQLSNSGFETWTGLGTGAAEPTEWSSIKTSDGGTFINNLAPQVCFQSADAHSGSYSVRLETALALGTFTANGTLTSGRVHAELDPANGYVFTDQGNTQWNHAITDRPDSLVGWFKATPLPGDHGKVEAVLHTADAKIPENGTFGNWVGNARWEPASATVNTWTRFSVPFTYYSTTAPAYALLVLTCGDSLVTQEGTQAWFDDIALIYNVKATPSTTVALVTGGMGFNFNMGFSTSGTPSFTTTFTAELSNSSGSFAAPTAIGSISTSGTSGTIACSIPAGTAPGIGYKVRVRNASEFYAPVPVNFTISNSVVKLQAKVFLDGPYDSGTQLMTDALRALSSFPMTEPYSDLGYAFIGGGTETVAMSVLGVSGNNAIVDWCVVELRDKNNSANVLRSRAALLQRDGDVVELDGTSALSFGLPADNYFVAVRHRNHLGCMRSVSVPLSATPTVVDLTLPATATFGTNARRTVGVRMTLWTGNALFDNVVKYAGSGNDRDRILTVLGGSVPTATLQGYHQEDVNLDGLVKYAGAGNDRDRVLQTIGGSVPTATRVQQLP